ncbi:MFS transporter [Comamonas testosteroni]|uniref:MFS transporter n=1 Tax=Comamonas testosteroni TaxID=285 RepID=A0A373FEI1_COMTE|nr:MFS transporter [Comamonas testosteroni]RGE41819.1 MFS transporter [Comamonas testosteroni]
MSTTSISLPAASRTRNLAAVALTLASFLAASSAPTPLYRLYQQAWGFSSGMLTLIFAVYAFSLLIALLTVGALSDYLGRRPVILTALGLEAISMLMFAHAQDAQALLWSRVVQGFATGMASAALGAALLDLDRERGPLVNTLAPMIGMAAGVFSASQLASHAGDGLHQIYWWLLLVFAASAWAIAVMPETVSRRPGALASLRPRIRLAAHIRPAFVRMAPMDVAAWALAGFYLSLGPTLLRVTTGSTLMAGLAVCINTLSAAAAIWLLRHWQAQRMLRFGGVVLPLGIAALLLGVAGHSLVLMVAASIIAGAGFGVGFQGALRSVLPLAEPHERGGLLSTIYVLSYLAFSLPAIAAGLLTQRFGLIPTTYGYGLMLIALALLALAGTGQQRVATAAK